MKEIEQSVKPLEDKLQLALAEVKKLKNAINTYYEAMGQPIRYTDVGQENAQGAAPRPDAYYGRALATVTTEVLEKRKEAGAGAATLDQLFTELSNGGFKFEGKNEGIQKRGLAISMSKNPKFHKLPNDTWGLTKWYPNVKDKKETITPTKEGNGIISDKNNEEELSKEEQ